MTRCYYSNFVSSFKSSEAKYNSPYLNIQMVFSCSKIASYPLTHGEFLCLTDIRWGKTTDKPSKIVYTKPKQK